MVDIIFILKLYISKGKRVSVDNKNSFYMLYIYEELKYLIGYNV